MVIAAHFQRNRQIERKMSRKQREMRLVLIANASHELSRWQSVWASRSENSNCDQNISFVWASIENLKPIRYYTRIGPALTHIIFRLIQRRSHTIGPSSGACISLSSLQSHFFFICCIFDRVNDSAQYTCASWCVGFVFSHLSLSIVLCEK